MSVSYKRLWHLLIDKDMKKKDLMEKANISDYTIRKLNRGDNVTTDVLVRICHAAISKILWRSCRRTRESDSKYAEIQRKRG